MITRRNFLAGAIAAAVAPSVVPEVFDAPASSPILRTMIGTNGTVSTETLTLAELRRIVAELKKHARPEIEYIEPRFNHRAFYYLDQTAFVQEVSA